MSKVRKRLQALGRGTSHQEDDERKDRKDRTNMQVVDKNMGHASMDTIYKLIFRINQEELGYLEDEYEDLKALFIMFDFDQV